MCLPIHTMHAVVVAISIGVASHDPRPCEHTHTGPPPISCTCTANFSRQSHNPDICQPCAPSACLVHLLWLSGASGMEKTTRFGTPGSCRRHHTRNTVGRSYTLLPPSRVIHSTCPPPTCILGVVQVSPLAGSWANPGWAVGDL